MKVKYEYVTLQDLFEWISYIYTCTLFIRWNIAIFQLEHIPHYLKKL